MDETNIDLHGYGPRLRKIAFATMIGAILTFFSMKAMLGSSRAPNSDPAGSSSVGMLAFAMFVMTTLFAHKILRQKRG